MALPMTLQAHRAVRSDPVRRPWSEAASALILVPALMLVLMCLGGIAVDLSLLHAAHRAAHRVTTAAADDAAAMIDTEHLQMTGELRIDPDRARRVARANLELGELPGRLAGSPDVVVDADGTVVTVTIELDIDHVMLRAVPGHPDHERIRVVSQARLNR